MKKLSTNAQKFLLALKTKTGAPYFDEIQPKSGLSETDAKIAVQELFDRGLVMHCAAPKGDLYYLMETGHEHE